MSGFVKTGFLCNRKFLPIIIRYIKIVMGRISYDGNPARKKKAYTIRPTDTQKRGNDERC
jgi:hypothetical protein